MSDKTMEELYSASSMEEDSSSAQNKEEAKKYLTFISDDLMFGVNAEYVTEIITNFNITILPVVPAFIKGIINLRGQIIPIIDIRMRMNKPECEYGVTACIIVLEVNSIIIGIFVDAVSQVVDVAETNVSPMPYNNQQELVSGMLTISDGTVMLLLDCEQI